MQSQKKAVKVSFQGETKRLKLTGDYNELINRIKSSWSGIPEPIKFFYLDEDNEIISITSQSDFSEALEIEDLSALKLVVAKSVQDARNQLQSAIEDNQPLAESINASQMMLNNSRTFRIGSEFQPINHSELDRSSTMNFIPNTERPVQHEIGIGGDLPMTRGIETGTDVNNLVTRENIGSNTVQINTCEKQIETHVEQTSFGTQARTAVRDAANDGFATETKAMGIQMTTPVTNAQTNCQLIVPDEEDDIDVEATEVTCIKCNGS